MLSSDHEQISDLLNAYLDGEVTPAERARVRRHLATCDLCQAELDSLRLTRQALQALPMLRAPRPFTLTQEAVLDAEGAGAAGERQHGGTVVPFPGSPRSRLPATASVPASDAPTRPPRWPTRLGLIWRVSSVAAAACALLFALQIASMSPVRPAPAALLRGEAASRQASGLDAAAAPRARQAVEPEPAAAAPAPAAPPDGVRPRSEAVQAAGARAEATAVPGAAAARERALQLGAATGAAASAPPRAPGGAEAVDSAAEEAQADLTQGQQSGAKGQASAAGAGRTETEALQSRRGGDGAATASRAQASGGDGRAAAVTLGLASLFSLAALAAFMAERGRGKGS